MTLQTGNLRRAVAGVLAGGAVAAGLLVGVGASTALADPADPAPTQPEISPDMSADDALAIIARDYDTGAGGGQLSTLVHEALKLRSLGFKASNTNRAAIANALEKRPNQAPLIEALKDTIAYQRKMQALTQKQGSQNQPPGYNFGIGQPPPGMGPAIPPGVPVEPGQNPGVFIGVG